MKPRLQSSNSHLLNNVNKNLPQQLQQQQQQQQIRPNLCMPSAGYCCTTCCYSNQQPIVLLQPIVPYWPKQIENERKKLIDKLMEKNNIKNNEEEGKVVEKNKTIKYNLHGKDIKVRYFDFILVC